ncbi:hypothetical protein FRC12_001011 [Ceratobasidium sp. 428]|nr:hypothetical protein FRC12_001011 [Ceratobasidium sp. 428]
MNATGSQWVIPTQWTWLATLLFIGLVGFLAQIFLTIGLQREAASRGTLALYTQIVFTVGFEYVAFGAIPPGLSILGAAIIIFSAVYVALNKPSTETPAEVELEEADELVTGHNNSIPLDAEGNGPVRVNPIRSVV